MYWTDGCNFVFIGHMQKLHIVWLLLRVPSNTGTHIEPQKISVASSAWLLAGFSEHATFPDFFTAVGAVLFLQTGTDQMVGIEPGPK